MLKQLKIYILVIAMSFVACNDDNEVIPLFEEESNTRVTTELEKYRNILKSAQNGWTAAYQPDENKAVFGIHFTFNEDNTVAISSDYNNGEDDLPSTYRVNIGQLPELIFENYSLLHKLFEVENFTLGAEYEFIIDEISEEKIVLKSESDSGDQSLVTLIPATSSDKDQILANRVQEERLKDDFDNNEYRRTFTVTDNTNTEVFKSIFSFNPVLRQINILGKHATTCDVLYETFSLKITDNGFDFIEPVIINNKEFTSFTFDENSNSFTSTVDNLTATLRSSEVSGMINEFALLIEIGKRSVYGYDIDKYGNSPLLDNSFWDIVATINTNLQPDSDKMLYWLWTLEPENNKAYLTFVGGRIDGSFGPFFADYEYDMTVTCDNIIKFTYVGLHDTGSGTSLANYWKTRIQPLLDFWSVPNGFIYEETGNFENDNNSDEWRLAGRFISVANPNDDFYGVWWTFTD
ncbi:DUF4302 domain-containing protein [Aquimarina sp. 2201CG1-2-11]|uniref:DUF4302 domain-containing protein n=1 Tax=Aquimarina discodermiae TaxID=3231043 RepID=UPI0034635103